MARYDSVEVNGSPMRICIAAPVDVDRIEQEFARHDIACEFHRYEGAGHAFQNFLSPERFRETAAEDSWSRTLAFLARTLA